MDKCTCKVCGQENEPECSVPAECPVCMHTHNHLGCRQCSCQICPKCRHIHKEHAHELEHVENK